MQREFLVTEKRELEELTSNYISEDYNSEGGF
jgi:hypothetical protein